MRQLVCPSRAMHSHRADLGGRVVADLVLGPGNILAVDGEFTDHPVASVLDIQALKCHSAVVPVVHVGFPELQPRGRILLRILLKIDPCCAGVAVREHGTVKVAQQHPAVAAIAPALTNLAEVFARHPVGSESEHIMVSVLLVADQISDSIPRHVVVTHHVSAPRAPPVLHQPHVRDGHSVLHQEHVVLPRVGANHVRSAVSVQVCVAGRTLGLAPPRFDLTLRLPRLPLLHQPHPVPAVRMIAHEIRNTIPVHITSIHHHVTPLAPVL
mmetsp:Transcript_25198/g.64501  ORF Transcript_25198/g.64501 Transcript_25198/m.64501 type:complete len:269 (+) Transcript_25198:1750-2556(+)